MYKPISFESQSDLMLLRSALFLAWDSLTKHIKDSSDKDDIVSSCRSLVRVIEMLQKIEGCSDG